jgi:hypothetical protein
MDMLGVLEGRVEPPPAAGAVPRTSGGTLERTVGRGALIDPKLELKLPPAQLAWVELQSHSTTAETDDDCWVPKVNAIIIASVPIGWLSKRDPIRRALIAPGVSATFSIRAIRVTNSIGRVSELQRETLRIQRLRFDVTSDHLDIARNRHPGACS